MPHLTGYVNVHKDVEYTAAQTGTAIWIPNTSKRFAVTDLTICVGGVTGGVLTLWQGASADTVFTQGTDPAAFRGEFNPTASTKDRFQKTFRIPFLSTTPDHQLKITTSAGMAVYIQIEGYEV